MVSLSQRGFPLFTAILFVAALLAPTGRLRFHTTEALQTANQPNRVSPCPRAIKITTNYQYGGTLHFICLQATNSRPRLDVIRYVTGQLVFSREVDELNTNQLASFVDNEGTLRILLAVPSRINGTSMYSIDAAGRFIDETHTINTQFVSTMTVWRLDLNWEWQLAIANQPTFEPLIITNQAMSLPQKPLLEPRPIISIHSWRSTYFDQNQLIHLPHDGYVNKIQPMNINGQEYIIVAMESSRQHDYPSNQHAPQTAGSLIYKLDISDGNPKWQLYQHLAVHTIIDASSFTVTYQGSLQVDYYIALLGYRHDKLPSNHLNNSGQNRLVPGATNRFSDSSNGHGLMIFKYFGDQFVRTHFFPVSDAIKLDAISYGAGDSYVVIALMSESFNRVHLFSFDGLILKPVHSPYTGVQSPPQQIRPGPYSRHRRTMDGGNMHLFMMPPTNQINESDSSDSTNKRQLSEDMIPSIRMPALAISNINEAGSLTQSGEPQTMFVSNNTEARTATGPSLYEIPVEEIVHQNAPIPDQPVTTNYNKRNLTTSMGQDVLTWCKSTIGNLLGDDFDSLINQMAALPKLDQASPIEINGDLYIESDLRVTNMLYAHKVSERRDLQPVVVEYAPLNLSTTFDEINRVHMAIDSMRLRVDQILVDDGSVQEVFTPLRFEQLAFECLNPISSQQAMLLHVAGGAPPQSIHAACPRIVEIQAGFLNSRNINDIQRQALLTGRSMTIARDVRFEHLVLRGSTQILDMLNDIPIDEIVFGRGHSTGPIIGQKILRSGLYSSTNLVVPNWGGLRVDRFNVLTSSGDQRIDANLRFSQVVLSDYHNQLNRSKVSTRFERLNGLHLDTHLSQIALADSSNNFELPLQIDELILNNEVSFSANSRLCAYDLENLWLNTMYKKVHQNVSAPMEFVGDVHVSYGGDILVDGRVNGLIMTPNNILMRNRNYDLPNSLVFDGDLNVRSLQLGTALNGVQVALNPESRRYELALLYDGGAQMLTGDKIFNEVYLSGNSYISGHINGHLNLTDLYRFTNNNDQIFRFANVRLAGTNFRVAPNAQMQITSQINNVMVNDLCSLAQRVSQSSVTTYNRIKLDQPASFNSLRCASINGFNDLTRSFLTRRGDQFIAGSLRAVKGVIFNSSVNIETSFNSLEATHLSRAVSQALQQTRTGHKDHYGDLIVDDLFTDRINDLHLSNVFLSRSDTPQVVRAPMVFDHLDIENVLVATNLHTRLFNGLNITDIVANTLQYDTPQVIYNHVELQTALLLQNSNFATKSINGHNLQRLYSDAVLRDTAQQILAPKTFRGPVEFIDRVFVRYGVDGLSEADLRLNLMLMGDELINGDLEFNTDVNVNKELEIKSRLINDIDVNSFVASLLSEKSDKAGLRILGNSSVRFKDVELNNLVVTGTVQGIDVSKDAVLTDANVVQSERRPHAPTVQPMSTASPQGGPRNWQRVQLSPPYATQAPPTQQSLYGAPLPTPMRLQQQQHSHKPNIQLPPQATQPRPPLIMQRPLNLVNSSAFETTWQPNWGVIAANTLQQFRPSPISDYGDANTLLVNNSQNQPNYYNTSLMIRPMHQLPPAPSALVDPRYLEHQAVLQAQLIRDLATRVNSHTSIFFYYETIQKGPLLGPVMHKSSNPMPNEAGSPLLFLKSTSRPGEPCLHHGQAIEVMAQSAHSAFTNIAQLKNDFSNPSRLESIVVGSDHYLFVLDSHQNRDSMKPSQIVVFLWDYNVNLYQVFDVIPVDHQPVSIRAFTTNMIGCVVALIQDQIRQESRDPLMICQHSPRLRFSERLTLNISRAYALDVMIIGRNKVALAALTHHEIGQVGKLVVGEYDLESHLLKRIEIRDLVRPLKVHFVQRATAERVNSFVPLQLVVSTGITSSDSVHPLTRIYAISSTNTGGRLDYRFDEIQTIKDEQFHDLQSCLMDRGRSFLFAQSANAISIYAPLALRPDAQQCGAAYQLVQRLPTKGANKFLVYNTNSVDNATQLMNHYMVLSRDDCVNRQHSTIILRARFS